MRINFIYRIGDTFPHSMGRGFIEALEELGHEVSVFEARLNSVNQKPFNKKMLEFLKQPADLILVMGGGDKYCGFYADSDIQDFMVHCPIPRLTYFMESMYSRTRTTSRYLRSVKCWSHILTVDESDVPIFKEMGCQKVDYVSGWVDEKVFRPMPEVRERVEFQFIGFPHIHRQPMIDFLKVKLGMENNRYPTLEDYVGGINETRILIGLPSVFKGFTQRVTETLACGKVLLYPTPPAHFHKSLKVFKDKEHIVFYNDMEELVELAKFYSDVEILRKQIEKNARAEILAKHTIKIRAQQFLDYANSISRP